MARPIIIDGNSLASRAIMATALEDLATGAQPTGGIYGTLNTMRATLSLPQMRGTHIVTCWDRGVPEFRKQLLPNYKAKRKEKKAKMTDEQHEHVYGQMKIIRNILRTLGVVVLRRPGWEADDLVAAVADVFVKRGDTPIVMSGDKDMYQLLMHGCDVYDCNLKQLVTPELMHDKYGVIPSTWMAYKAILGDDSDGIVGVHGCGAVGAVKAINAASEHYARYSNGVKYEDLSPFGQITAIEEWLKSLDKMSSVQTKILGAIPHLHTVLKATILHGTYEYQPEFAEKCVEASAPQKREFLRMCAKLKFASVLANIDHWVGPYAIAHKARTA